VKTLPGQLTITRTMNGRDDQFPITIRLTDGSSGVQAVEIHISLADFAETLTGLAHVPCEFEWNDTGTVGKVHEHKKEIVWIPRGAETDGVIAAALAPFEVDGWRAYRPGCTNPHCVVGREPPGKGEKGDWYKVTFHRYVEPTVRGSRR
jgi:hypothetical protein